MKIDIESSMQQAARNGLDGYQPIFRDQPLEVEACIPEVSLRNLRVLLKAGLEVSTMTVVEEGHVLIAFKTGETYLATGFAVGQVSDLTKFFSQFASEAFSGSQSEWESHIAYFYEPEHQGLIEPMLTADLQPRIFQE